MWVMVGFGLVSALVFKYFVYSKIKDGFKESFDILFDTTSSENGSYNALVNKSLPPSQTGGASDTGVQCAA